jgi:hypothetical protein
MLAALKGKVANNQLDEVAGLFYANFLLPALGVSAKTASTFMAHTLLKARAMLF